METASGQEVYVDPVEQNKVARTKKLIKRKRKHSEANDEDSTSSLEDGAKYLKIKIDVGSNPVRNYFKEIIIIIFLFQKAKVLQKIDSLKQKVKFLQEENKTLRKENIVLRSNNIKFQIEIFNLQNESAGSGLRNSDDAVEVQDEEFEDDDQDCVMESVEYEEIYEAPEVEGPAFHLKQESDLEQEQASQVTLEVEEHYLLNEDHFISSLPTKTVIKREKKPKLEIETFQLPEPGQKQQEILQQFQIELNPTDLDELNAFGSGHLNDQKFINKLLPLIFDKKVGFRELQIYFLI